MRKEIFSRFALEHHVLHALMFVASTTNERLSSPRQSDFPETVLFSTMFQFDFLCVLVEVPVYSVVFELLYDKNISNHVRK